MRRLLLYRLCLLSLCTFVFMGCEEDVDPLLGNDLPFTLWGQMNPKADTQAVRVFSIENQLSFLDGSPLDLTMTSTHLQSGETHVWQDSLVTLENGEVRHVYWAAFRANFEQTYRLEARRSDGRTTSVEVTTPPDIPIEVPPPNENQARPIFLPIVLQGVPPAIPRLEVEYFATTASDPDPFNPEERPFVAVPVHIPYTDAVIRTREGFSLNIDLVNDFQTIRSVFSDNDLPSDFIALRYMQIHVHVGDETWIPPTDTFDADLLVEPGVFSNVENGFGFFGAGYIQVHRWTPPTILLQRAGFTL